MTDGYAPLRDPPDRPRLHWPGKADGIARLLAAPLVTVASHGPDEPASPAGVDSWCNRLVHGDCSVVLAILGAELAHQVDLIYVDPPFMSGASFATFEDRWGRDRTAYCDWLQQTILALHELLAPTGTIYCHLDWRASHYAKVLLDEVFGDRCFRNEIIWRRDFGGKGAKRRSRQWPRNFDSIFVYSQSDHWTFTQLDRPLNVAQQRAYRHAEPNGRRFKAVQLGDYSSTTIQTLAEAGLIYTSASGRRYKKYYLDEARSVVDCIWTDLPGFGTRTAAREYRRYPTQKPESLLERIIRASSQEGDLVLDCFVGSGTTAIAAEHLHRRWIAADASIAAIDLTQQRLREIEGHRPFVVQRV